MYENNVETLEEISELWYSDPEAGVRDEDWEEPEEEGAPPPSESSESYTLKHLGQEHSVTRDELITLAQKGMDYDRIRRRADRLMLEPGESDASLDQETCLRRDQELLDFVAAYRDVTPDDIPPEVWAEVETGQPLLTAYQGYENRVLKAQIAADRQINQNRRRSTGSASTAGLSRERGELEQDWYSGN